MSDSILNAQGLKRQLQNRRAFLMNMLTRVTRPQYMGGAFVGLKFIAHDGLKGFLAIIPGEHERKLASEYMEKRISGLYGGAFIPANFVDPFIDIAAGLKGV